MNSNLPQSYFHTKDAPELTLGTVRYLKNVKVCLIIYPLIDIPWIFCQGSDAIKNQRWFPHGLLELEKRARGETTEEHHQPKKKKTKMNKEKAIKTDKDENKNKMNEENTKNKN